MTMSPSPMLVGSVITFHLATVLGRLWVGGLGALSQDVTSAGSSSRCEAARGTSHCNALDSLDLNQPHALPNFVFVLGKQ